MQILARAVLLLSTAALLSTARNDAQHPDLLGLLALKATICGNCSELSSWTPSGAVCETFDGVYCAWIHGVLRVVSVQLQMPQGAVCFNSSGMEPAGQLQGLAHLRELEVLCVKQRPGPGPGPPPPTPTNEAWDSRTKQQQQQQQQGEAAAAEGFRSGLHHTAAGGLQGLWVSRWLAAAQHNDTSTTAAAAAAAGGSSPVHSLSTVSSSAAAAAAAGAAAGGAAAAAAAADRSLLHSLSSTSSSVAGGAGGAGELPSSWFRAYPQLTHLRVVGCGVNGSLSGAGLGGALYLASLVLSHNDLGGALPEELIELQDLTVLDLSANHFSGPLPTSWVALQQLHYLYLNNNNLSGTLPCEYSQLQLRLADLSGNHWVSSPIDGDLTQCDSHSSLPVPAVPLLPYLSAYPWQPPLLPAGSPPSSPPEGHGSAAADTVTEADVSTHQFWPGGWGAALNSQTSSSAPGQHWQQQQRRRQRRLQQQPLHSTGSTGIHQQQQQQQQKQQQLQHKGAGGSRLVAPRCWLRRYCYDEGAFICLQRQAGGSSGGSGGGCSSYVYGASDLHIDPLNQCDHGGSHLVGIGVMFTVFAAALLLTWLHHCRVVRWMHQPPPGISPQQQQQQGPWQQRQWLISGPSPPSRARARSLGAGTGSAIIHSNTNSSLKDPLLPPGPGPLPLLYHPATAEHEGAGYSSPVSSSSAVDFLDTVPVGTPDGLLPSALTTPSAGAISIRPQGPLGFSGPRNAPTGGQGLGRRGSPGSLGEAAASAAAAATAGGGGRGLGSSRGGAGDASGYESDSGSSAAGGVGGESTTVQLAGHWLKPGYYFHGNEPLPPWAGGVARMLAATLAPADGSDGRGGGRGSSGGCFTPGLMVPLVFLLLDTVTNLRLLLLWGVGPPAHVKLWPSYALLGLTCVPHLLVGAVVHFRLLAVACLPPALKAASTSLISEDILPPGSQLLVRVYAWLFAAPAWLAYPLILLLLGPGVVLLTLLCPLVLVAAAVGCGSLAGVMRYIQLLQGCAALTQSIGSAALLTVLFLLGNLPLEWAFLDASLYYLTTAADLANIAVAWWLRLAAARRQQALALAALPGATGQQWT